MKYFIDNNESTPKNNKFGLKPCNYLIIKIMENTYNPDFPVCYIFYKFQFVSK